MSAIRATKLSTVPPVTQVPGIAVGSTVAVGWALPRWCVAGKAGRVGWNKRVPWLGAARAPWV